MSERYKTKFGGHESSPDGCRDDCAACQKEQIAETMNTCLDLADRQEVVRTDKEAVREVVRLLAIHEHLELMTRRK